MAASSGRKTSSSTKKKTLSTTRSTGKTKTSAKTKKANARRREQDSALFHEIGLIVLFAVMALLFCCNFGMIGPAGDAVSGVMFGLFGMTAYIAPLLVFLAAAFWYANEGNPNALRKLIAGILLFVMLGIICDLLTGQENVEAGYHGAFIYESCRDNKAGGGILAGSISFALKNYLGVIGAVLVILVCSIVCLILLTEKSLISSLKEGGNRVREFSREDTERRRENAERRREDAERRKEQNRLRRQEQEEERARREEERRLRAEEIENEKILRMERKVSGVMLDATLPKPTKTLSKSDMHEITLPEEEILEEALQQPGSEEIANTSDIQTKTDEVPMEAKPETEPAFEQWDMPDLPIRIHKEGMDDTENVIPENVPSYDQDTKRKEEEEMFPSDAARSETMALFEQDTDAQKHTGIMAQDMEAQNTAETLGQDMEALENMETFEQNMDVQENVETFEQDRDVQENVETFEQDMDAQENVETFEQNMDVQETFEQDRKPQEKPKSTAASVGTVRPSAPKFADTQTGQSTNQRIMGEKISSGPGTLPIESNFKTFHVPKQYMFPSISLLQKGAVMTGDSARELKETALHLQQTLSTFGVRVTITDISQGPSVTRYELQPEQGVKVSKIVSLTDDIKLNLAAMDIRIEAPIPGKAAIGIEVPNKESIPVMLRDLLETDEFRNFPSNLAFAVGKDIAGKVIVADIAKMPHMLIAGATGSGKSVCINTLIMGVLYKAHPDDVKLIMIDPKVVELSVYNGIPHLLIPVVTDPKKASAALHWGVVEMEERYRKFAEYNVRDLKGYNKKIEAMGAKREQNALKKLPQIVIIVDELADLMMVCPGEVEESICRLAQLARAAGIHLIIATQRPSVDVITGLIKANMPSRVAFSVSSGVDSRTILDMVGAEKLLGKGDMLFYPQGYAKPARVQGAFVSDNEVSDVVDFMKNQTLGNTYAEEIEEKIKNMGSASGGASGNSEVDELFEKAGRIIIEKDKASIGMLQRALQIGFNRAARIMDQLNSYGVVGEEEGTKPRKILMSPEQFEQLLEEV